MSKRNPFEGYMISFLGIDPMIMKEERRTKDREVRHYLHYRSCEPIGIYNPLYEYIRVEDNFGGTYPIFADRFYSKKDVERMKKFLDEHPDVLEAFKPHNVEDYDFDFKIHSIRIELVDTND
jgi:hypothetical protein